MGWSCDATLKYSYTVVIINRVLTLIVSGRAVRNASETILAIQNWGVFYGFLRLYQRVKYGLLEDQNVSTKYNI